MVDASKKYKNQIRDVKKEREKTLLLKHRFETRITTAKNGKSSFNKGDFIAAVKKYTDYLETMAEIHKVPSYYQLRPDHFNKTKDVTEMLAISHLFFELAKVYDATGKFKDDVKLCLESFVYFSANQPYQILNSEMLRKHIRKFSFRNHDLFTKSYEQIFVQSKKCYIATFAFGENHPTTLELRGFKRWLEIQPTGLTWIRLYYQASEKCVLFAETYPMAGTMLNLFAKPILYLFARMIKKSIL
jgi:hypothetical protein